MDKQFQLTTSKFKGQRFARGARRALPGEVDTPKKQSVWLLKQIGDIIDKNCPVGADEPHEAELRRVLRDSARLAVYRLHSLAEVTETR